MEYMLLIAEIVVLESEMIIAFWYFSSWIALSACSMAISSAAYMEVSLDSLTFMVDFGVIIAYPVPRVFFDPSV